MATHSFTLLLSGPDPTEPAVFSKLEAQGCDDALFGVRAGVPFADFDRDAATIGDAVLSAIGDVERTVPDLMVLRVEPEEFVTASGIAARTGRTRESVRLWIEGRRGPGGFPAPVVWLEGRTRLWKWTDVSQWLSEAMSQEFSADSAMLAAINAWLELRRYGGALAETRHAREFASMLGEELNRLSA
ncbi:MAG: helix-turn-helix transcriptional regulator [Candidatus Dormibacteria bacterium]